MHDTNQNNVFLAILVISASKVDAQFDQIMLYDEVDADAKIAQNVSYFEIIMPKVWGGTP